MGAINGGRWPWIHLFNDTHVRDLSTGNLLGKTCLLLIISCQKSTHIFIHAREKFTRKSNYINEMLKRIENWRHYLRKRFFTNCWAYLLNFVITWKPYGSNVLLLFWKHCAIKTFHIRCIVGNNSFSLSLIISNPILIVCSVTILISILLDVRYGTTCFKIMAASLVNICLSSFLTSWCI